MKYSQALALGLDPGDDGLVDLRELHTGPLCTEGRVMADAIALHPRGPDHPTCTVSPPADRRQPTARWTADAANAVIMVKSARQARSQARAADTGDRGPGDRGHAHNERATPTAGWSEAAWGDCGLECSGRKAIPAHRGFARLGVHDPVDVVTAHRQPARARLVLVDRGGRAPGFA